MLPKQDCDNTLHNCQKVAPVFSVLLQEVVTGVLQGCPPFTLHRLIFFTIILKVLQTKHYKGGLTRHMSIVQCLVGVSEMGPGVLWSSTILVLSAPLLQLHSMWVAVAACKSLPATLAETTVILTPVTTSRNQLDEISPSLSGSVFDHNFNKLPLTLQSVCKIGSVVYKIGQSWSSCCAKSWLCSRVVLQIRGLTFKIFRLRLVRKIKLTITLSCQAEIQLY